MIMSAKDKAYQEAMQVVKKLRADGLERKRQKELTPDKDKILSFCADLDNIFPPRCENEELNVILNSAIKEIYAVAGRIREKVEEI